MLSMPLAAHRNVNHTLRKPNLYNFFIKIIELFSRNPAVIENSNFWLVRNLVSQG